MTNHSNSAVPYAAPDDRARASAWSVDITRVDAGQIFGALPRAAPRRFRYITVTLEYAYRGAGRAELAPDTIVLMCAGSSPLQGLTQSPGVYLDEETGHVLWPGEELIVLSIAADRLQRATLVYAFHEDCREFRLYFPECEGIAIRLEEMTGAKT
ncbi:MAG: hypothetical protein HY870_23915 [Chloroflexi bacterium]|nr:hypothetical protein [Chloroflexota bacterium]